MNSMVEFVYPKADAVAIAKSNQSKVPAIDPASEGKVADKNLSQDDMEVVTLWLLSSTTVGPNDSAPAIKAEKYQQVATNEPPPPPAQQLDQSRQTSATSTRSDAPVASAAVSPAPVRAPRAHKPVRLRSAAHRKLHAGDLAPRCVLPGWCVGTPPGSPGCLEAVVTMGRRNSPPRAVFRLERLLWLVCLTCAIYLTSWGVSGARRRRENRPIEFDGAQGGAGDGIADPGKIGNRLRRPR